MVVWDRYDGFSLKKIHFRCRNILLEVKPKVSRVIIIFEIRTWALICLLLVFYLPGNEFLNSVNHKIVLSLMFWRIFIPIETQEKVLVKFIRYIFFIFTKFFMTEKMYSIYNQNKITFKVKTRVCSGFAGWVTSEWRKYRLSWRWHNILSFAISVTYWSCRKNINHLRKKSRLSKMKLY